MIRDLFYQDIIQGLSGRLAPELFEQCAGDLLRNIYPGLVPIRGGSDAVSKCRQNKVTIIESDTYNWAGVREFSFNPCGEVYTPIPYIGEL